MTQRELAIRLGVTEKTIWRWEHGKSVGSLGHRRALMELMEKAEDRHGAG